MQINHTISFTNKTNVIPIKDLCAKLYADNLRFIQPQCFSDFCWLQFLRHFCFYHAECLRPWLSFFVSLLLLLSLSLFLASSSSFPLYLSLAISFPLSQALSPPYSVLSLPPHYSPLALPSPRIAHFRLISLNRIYKITDPRYLASEQTIYEI